jgi:hypothetical protein
MYESRPSGKDDQTRFSRRGGEPQQPENVNQYGEGTYAGGMTESGVRRRQVIDMGGRDSITEVAGHSWGKCGVE